MAIPLDRLMPSVLAAFAVMVGNAAALAAQPPQTLVVGTSSEPRRYAVSGQVEAVRQAALAAQVTGRITRVAIANGDTVRAGQLLISIDASEAADTHAAAVSALAAADAALVNARDEHARAQRLRAQDYISEAAMQRADAQLRAAEAQAAAQKSMAAAARKRQGWYALTAPYDGRVTSLSVAAGDLATPGRPLLTVYDPGALRVTAQLPEAVAGRLNPKGSVMIGSAAPGEATTVQSWQIVPAVDATSRSVTIRVELAGGLLQPGQMLALLLPLSSGAQVLRVPRTAIVRRSELTGLYVLDDKGQSRLRQVRLGAVSGNEVEVLAGLRAGERVVVDAAGPAGR